MHGEYSRGTTTEMDGMQIPLGQGACVGLQDARPTAAEPPSLQAPLSQLCLSGAPLLCLVSFVPTLTHRGQHPSRQQRGAGH